MRRSKELGRVVAPLTHDKPDDWKGCNGKRAWPTKDRARRALAALRKSPSYERPPGAGPLCVYHCKRCRAYHVGHRGRPPGS